MARVSDRSISSSGYIVTTWIGRVVLVGAACLRPSIISIVYGLLAIASFCLAPLFSSPLSLFGRKPKQQYIIAIAATIVAGIACVLHVIFQALLSEGVDQGNVFAWRIAGYFRNDSVGDWVLALAPDISVLAAGVAWIIWSSTIQHHRIRKSWTILGASRGVTSTTFICALIAASILRPTTLTAPLFVGLMVQVLRWGLTRSTSFKEPFISHEQWFSHTVYAYTGCLLVLIHIWQLMPTMLDASGASPGAGLRVRRVGAGLGLVQLQTVAADWAVYSSYAAIGMLHAAAAAVSQRVLGDVALARKMGERFHAVRAAAQIAIQTGHAANPSLAGSVGDQSPVAMSKRSPGLHGAVRTSASAAAPSSQPPSMGRRDTEISVWIEGSHADRQASLLSDDSGGVGGGTATRSDAAGGETSGGGRLAKSEERSTGGIAMGGGRSASVVARSRFATPPRPADRPSPGRNSAMAAINRGSDGQPLPTIGEDSGLYGPPSAAKSSSSLGGKVPDYPEHPDDHDLLEREGVRRDSSQMSSLELPPQGKGGRLGLGSGDPAAVRIPRYRTRQDTRFSVISVAASLMTSQSGAMFNGAVEPAPTSSCINCYGMLKSRSGQSIETVSGLVAELAGRVIGGRLGFSLIGVLVLAWCTTYPSLTTLPLLAWVLVTASTYSSESSFDRPRAELYFFVPYLAVTAIAFYVACIFGAWRVPDAILESATYPGGPYASNAPIRSTYSNAWELAGIIPLLRPVVRLLLNFGLIMVLATYHKVTILQEVAREHSQFTGGNAAGDAEEGGSRRYNRPHSPLHALVSNGGLTNGKNIAGAEIAPVGASSAINDEDDELGMSDPKSAERTSKKRMSTFSRSLVGQSPDGQLGVDSRPDRSIRSYSTTETEVSSIASAREDDTYTTCWDISCGPGPYSIYSLFSGLLVLLRGYAFVIALTVLYVLGLSHVDLIHTGYVIIFIVFFVSSDLRRDYWRWLVVYTSLAIGFLFIWHVAAHQINPETENTPPWVVGLVVGPDSSPLWRTTFVSNGIILVFSMIQLPQYIDEQEGVYSEQMEDVMARYQWLSGGGALVAKAMRRYGTWLCYAVYFCLSLLPQPDCLGMVTLVMLFVILGTHLSMGVSAPTRKSSATSAIMYLLTVMAVIQASYLVARYVFQFGGLATWFQDQFWEQLDLQKFLTVRELGLQRYVDDNYSGDLYVSLLDSFVMLLLTVVQIGFLSDMAKRLARREEFIRAAMNQGSISQSIRGRRAGGSRATMADARGVSPDDVNLSEFDQEATLKVDDDLLLSSNNACVRFLASGFDAYRKFAFYHSGKLTLLLCFIVATLQDTVTAAILALAVTTYAAIMTYRQDPGALDTSCLDHLITCRCLCCCCWLCGTTTGGMEEPASYDRRQSQMASMSVSRAVEIGGMPARQIRRLVDELPDPATVWQNANASSEDEAEARVAAGPQTRRGGVGSLHAGGRATYQRRKQLRSSRSLTSVLVQFFADTLAAETGRDRARTGSSVKMFAQLDAERRHQARKIAEQEGVQPGFDGYVALQEGSDQGSGSSSGSDGSRSSVEAARRAAARELGKAYREGSTAATSLFDHATEHLLHHAATSVRLPPAPISAYRAGYMPQLLRRERIASAPRRPFRDVWLLIVLYGIFMTLLSFAYQFRVFRHGTWYGESEGTQWIGFYRIESKFNGGSGNPERITYDDMWGLLFGYAIVIAACVLQRWSHDYESYVMKAESLELRRLERTGSLDALAMERLVDDGEVKVRSHEKRAVELLRRVGEQRIQRIKLRAAGGGDHGRGGASSAAASGGRPADAAATTASTATSSDAPAEAKEPTSSAAADDSNPESTSSRFVSASVQSYYGKLPSRESLPKLELEGLEDIDMTDPRLVLGLAAWYDVMYNAPILHRLVAADASESATAIASLLDGSPRLRRSVSDAVDQMDSKLSGLSHAASAYQFRYGLCSRDRAILSAGKHVLALRARLNRHRVTMWQGLRKAMQRHAARIFNDLTAVALIVAAFCHLDIWSVVLLVMAVFALLVAGDDKASAHLFKPAEKRRIMTSHHRTVAGEEPKDAKTASPAQSFARSAVMQHLAANGGVVRSWLWPAMTVVLAVMIGLRYVATVGWPPFLRSVRDRVWPWSDDEAMQYYFGVGETVTGLQLLPDFIALLIASLTKRQWWTDQSAAEALLELTAGFSRVQKDQAQAPNVGLRGISQADAKAESVADTGGGPIKRHNSDSAGDSLDVQILRQHIATEFPVLNAEDLNWLCQPEAMVERQQIRRFRQSAMHLYAGEVLAGALSRAFGRQQYFKNEQLNRYALKIAAALQYAQRTGTDASFRVKHHHSHHISRQSSRRLLPQSASASQVRPTEHLATVGKSTSGHHATGSASSGSGAGTGGSDSPAQQAGGLIGSAASAAGTQSVRTSMSGSTGSSKGDLTQDLALAQTMASAWDWVQLTIGLLSWNVVILVLFLVASVQQEQNLIIGGYFLFSLWFMYRPEATRKRTTSDPMFLGLRWFNMLVIFMHILYQAPFIPAPEQCSTTTLCFSWQTVIGLQKFRVVTINGSEPCLASDSVQSGAFQADGDPVEAMPRQLHEFRGFHEGLISMSEMYSLDVQYTGAWTDENAPDLEGSQEGHWRRRTQAEALLPSNSSSAGTGVTSNVDCPTPFNAQNGILTSFVLLILVSLQLQIYQSDSYMSVRAYLSSSQHRATRRGQVCMEMEADARAHQARSLARQQKRLRMRVSNLVRKTEKWHNLLSGDTDEGGASFSPPPPPRELTVDVLPDGSVRVRWSPPKGYRDAFLQTMDGGAANGEGAEGRDGQGDEGGADAPGIPAPADDQLAGDDDNDDDRSSVTNTDGSELSNEGADVDDAKVQYIVAWQRKLRKHSQTQVTHSMFGYTVAKRTNPGVKVAVIRGLNPAFDYRIKIAAMTEAGMGRFAESTHVTLSHWIEGGVQLPNVEVDRAIKQGERPAAFIDRRLALREEVKEKVQRMGAHSKPLPVTSRRAARPAEGPENRDDEDIDRPIFDENALEESGCGCEGGCAGFSMWMLDTFIHSLHNGVDRILYPKSIVDYDKFSSAVSAVADSLLAGPKSSSLEAEEDDMDEDEAKAADTESTGYWCCGCCQHDEADDADRERQGPAWWSFLVCGLCGAGDPEPESLTLEEEEVGAESSDDEADNDAWSSWLQSNGREFEDLRLAARESMAMGMTSSGPGEEYPELRDDDAVSNVGREVDDQDDADARLAGQSVFSDARGRGISGGDPELFGFTGPRPRAPTVSEVRRLSIGSFASLQSGPGLLAEARRESRSSNSRAGQPFRSGREVVTAEASRLGDDQPNQRASHATDASLEASPAAGPEAPIAAAPQRVRIADGESTVITAMGPRLSNSLADHPTYPSSALSKMLLIVFLFVRVLLSHTKALAGFTLFLSTVSQANFLSMAPFGVFVLIHLSAYPRPSAAQWDFIIIYLIFVLLLKFVVQLPVFCMIGSGPTDSTWALRLVSDPDCGVSYVPPTGIVEGAGIQPLLLFGLFKYQSVYGGSGFASSVLWDLLSLLALILHRETLRQRGIWLDEGQAHSRSWVLWLTGDSGDAQEYVEQQSRQQSAENTPIHSPAAPASDAGDDSDEGKREEGGETLGDNSASHGSTDLDVQVREGDTTGPQIIDDRDEGIIPETAEPDHGAVGSADSEDDIDDIDDIDDAGMAAGGGSSRSPAAQQLRRRRMAAPSERSIAVTIGTETPARDSRFRRQAAGVDDRSCCAKFCCVLSLGCCYRARKPEHAASLAQQEQPLGKDGKMYTVKDMTAHLNAHRNGTVSRIDAERGIGRRLDLDRVRDIPMVEFVIQLIWYSLTLFVWAVVDYYFSTVNPDHRGGTWSWVQKGGILHSSSPGTTPQGHDDTEITRDSQVQDRLPASRGDPTRLRHSAAASLHQSLAQLPLAQEGSSTIVSTASSERRPKQKHGEPTRTTKPGRDLYIWSASLQLFVLLYTVLFYGAMTGGGTDISQELAQNQFSGRMVLAAILQILCIVCERLAYLWRSLLLKVIIHWASVIAVHWVVFFQTPLNTNVEFSDRVSLIVYYCLWVLYFLVGAKQIQVGYARTPPTDSMFSHGYHWVRGTIFSIYTAIPFLFELRQILDWTTASTSMDVWMWLKLAAIQANLFRVQTDMTYRRSFKTVFNGREQMPFYMKLLNGWLIVLLLLAIIIAPIIVFSTLNPVLVQNPVLHARVGLSLRGFEAEGAQVGVFNLFETDTVKESRVSGNFTRNYWNSLLDNVTRDESLGFSSEMQSQAQFIGMEPYPVDAWIIAPPALDQLVDLLRRAGNASGNATQGTLPKVTAQLDYSFLRDGPQSYEQIGKTASIELNPVTSLALYESLRNAPSVSEDVNLTLAASGARGMLSTEVGLPTYLENMYAYIERNPATTDPIALTSDLQRTLALQLHAGSAANAQGGSLSSSLWWTLEIAPFPADRFGSQFGDGLEFNLINDKVAPDILVQTLGGNSILAVYTLIIVTLGGLIRGLFLLPVERVPYQEMEQVLDLLELCDGIRLAQNETKFERHLENEMYLYRLLLRLHRSPEVLLRITKLAQRPDDPIEPDDYGQTVV